MNEEYHKGEWCPYAKAMGRSPVLCQEGYCDSCQIYLDYSDRVASRSEGVSVSDCPLKLKVCYPSCYWWEDGKCIFKKEAEMVENEITLSLTKSQLIVVAFLVGEFYRFMVKEGVTEVSIGHEEVADLVDKLTEAVKAGDSQ